MDGVIEEACTMGCQYFEQCLGEVRRVRRIRGARVHHGHTTNEGGPVDLEVFNTWYNAESAPGDLRI